MPDIFWYASCLQYSVESDWPWLHCGANMTLLQFIFNGSMVNRVLALVALILAFPPIFTKKGHTEGLLMSLSLLVFYIVRGLLSLTDTLGRNAAIRPSQFFRFAEIPALFSVIYFGLQMLPPWLAAPYQWSILMSSPVFILLEGVSSMVIILECGERVGEALKDAALWLQGLVASVCFGLFGVSFYVIYEIYQDSLLGVASASFVASIVTLLAVLTIATVIVEHGSITDSSLLSLYVTYNIWCITRTWRDRFFSAAKFESIYDLLLSPSRWFKPGSIFMQNSMLSAITALVSMFSVEIVVHLIFQMCVFVLAVRLIGRALQASGTIDTEGERSEDYSEERGDWLVYQDWIFNVIWPSFGKAVLVLVYTYAWILHTQPELVQQEWGWTNPTTWRYVNIVLVILVYVKHLATPPDEPIFKID